MPCCSDRAQIFEVLGDPKRLRTAGGHGFLISWKHLLRTQAEADAAEMVKRLLDDPRNVDALREGLGRPEASTEDLAQWLLTGFTAGALQLLQTTAPARIFDRPEETDLIDLLPPEEPKRQLESLTFAVVDQAGQGVTAAYQVYAPSGDTAGSLPAGERRFVGDLEPRSDVEIELSSIVLPLRPKHDEPGPLGPDPEPERPQPGPKADAPQPTGSDPSTHAPARPNPRPSSETAWFEARVVDELGEPIEGTPLTFVVDGAEHPATTDAAGLARIEAAKGAGTVTLDDQDGLLEALRPRWEQVRPGPWLKTGEHHTVLSPSNAVAVVQVRSEQAHTLVLQPKVLLARIRGMLFDTNRAFLLPGALEHLPRLTALYDDHPQSTLLLAGHTDVTGEPAYNDPLSLERADAVAAFLQDDVGGWLQWYEPSVPVEKRWGAYEDSRMLSAVLDRTGEDVHGSPLLHFQRTRGLEPDGVAGPVTREALIGEYMALDGTSLPPGVEIQRLGCGERFPLGEDDGADRRVELLFFDQPLGVLPPAPGEVCPAGDETYLEWQRRASETIDLDAGTHVHSIVLDDPLFGVAASVAVEATYQTGRLESLETDAEGRVPLEPGGGEYVDLRFTVRGREMSRRVFTAIDDVASREGAWQRLVHLGYTELEDPQREAPDDDALADALMAFQLDYGLEPSAELDDETMARLLRAHDQDLRPWRERDWELPAEPDPGAAKPKEEVS
ncbi:MAG: OmpA family protein [Myxococcota bacterium]